MNALAPHPALQRKPETDGALCQLVGDWSGKVPAGGVIVEPKVDGIRALWLNGELVTREGAPILGTEHIAQRLRAIEHDACRPMFFDGEFQVAGAFGPTIAHFQARGGRGNVGTLFLFDAIPMDCWHGREPSETLEARRGKLDRMAAAHVGDGLAVLPWAFMTDAADVADKARELIAAGGEGVVVKHALSTYRRSRSANWQRIRKSLTLDLPIVGMSPHQGNMDRMGALILGHEGKRVRVSAGFSDAERREMWAARERLVGTIAEIEAMERTAAGSLRSAVFCRLRPDKGARP